MFSPPSSLYADLGRFLRNRRTRVGLLAVLTFALIYHFNEQTRGRVSQTWLPNAFNNLGSVGPRVEPNQVSMESQVGKVHAVFGEPNPVYERALKLHEAHSNSMGHPMFVLRERLLSGLWSKPAFILSIVLQELAKAEDERLKWLLWIDADIVVMNPQISLDIFIPPNPDFNDVNMLVTNDRHGLNNGCFLIRVNSWAVKLLSAVIAFHTFKPEVELKYSEQSALEEMIEDSYWRRSVVHVPQYWFNAYPASAKEITKRRPHEFRQGGLQIHFAGNRDGKKPERMETWMDLAEQQITPYNAPVEQVALLDDIRDFWAKLSEKRKKKGSRPVQDPHKGNDSHVDVTH